MVILRMHQRFDEIHFGSLFLAFWRGSSYIPLTDGAKNTHSLTVQRRQNAHFMLVSKGYLSYSMTKCTQDVSEEGTWGLGVGCLCFHRPLQEPLCLSKMGLFMSSVCSKKASASD